MSVWTWLMSVWWRLAWSPSDCGRTAEILIWTLIGEASPSHPPEMAWFCTSHTWFYLDPHTATQVRRQIFSTAKITRGNTHCFSVYRNILTLYIQRLWNASFITMSSSSVNLMKANPHSFFSALLALARMNKIMHINNITVCTYWTQFSIST